MAIPRAMMARRIAEEVVNDIISSTMTVEASMMESSSRRSSSSSLHHDDVDDEDCMGLRLAAEYLKSASTCAHRATRTLLKDLVALK